MRLISLLAVLSLTACGGGDTTPPVQPAEFTNIECATGYVSCQANAISADGSAVAVTATGVDGRTQAFRWTVEQGMTALGFLPGGTHSTAVGISADGTVIVGNGGTTIDPASSSSGFRWTAGTGIARIDPVPGSSLCVASGVSGDGQTVAGTCLTFNNEAFRWTRATGAVGLGRFGGGSNQTSSASAISSNAMVVVGAGHPILTGAVAWPTTGGANALGKLPGDDSATATAVSRDGTLIAGTSFNSAQMGRAFRWNQQTGMTALGTFAGLQATMVTGISGDGMIIVGWATTATGDTAIIWDAQHGLRPLDIALLVNYQAEVPGWRLARATAISDDGRTIAGYGINPSGQTRAWIVKLPG
jgi:probable HAF family extracellular repeat protein